MPIKTFERFPNFYEVQHPIVQYKLSLLRDKETNRKLFKELTEELTMLLGYEATADIPMTTKKVSTPLETFDAPFLKNNQFVIAPILRAGIGMSEGLLKLLPMASVGFIGYYRDEKTREAMPYYFKLPPNCEKAHFFLCDPMLATGNTSCAAIKKLKEKGVYNIKFICMVAAPEGVQQMLDEHPDVPIFGASLDRQLNENAYILPGLGDAGDRLWAVK
ncbi:MAG: uracil phosphoribosyltransferase [Gammaproteobacteria bacterium]|nr:uracil phosphoribosyltransferase [Gammaproteobacteria bacterium]